jgi:hypothetical protein
MKNISVGIRILTSLLAPGLLFAAAAGAGGQGNARAYEGEFFIVSSVNQKMHEMFLKAPTEVTELMLVNNKTVFLDEQGKRVTFKDLRSGDTVYVVADRTSGGEPLATRVEMGPMTAAILHARYIK